ncbi:MAG: DUF2585 family protein [Pyrinomonadaceae bacterium]
MLTTHRKQIAATTLIIIGAAAALAFQGRVWWCQVGDLRPWSWEVWSAHNSQHVVDPYSFTHVLHGMLEFWLIGLVFWKLPPAWRFVIAIFIESSWEVIENTEYVINRYREATVSLDYFGDTIVNSLADVVCCGVGFWVSYKLRFVWAAAIFLLTETVLLFWIRDSLLLNILMLLRPIEAVKRWQLGA